MHNLQGRAVLKIHDGKLGGFKELAAQCIDPVKANEPGALQYDWFFNPDHTECVVMERYTDSHAVLAHLANVGSLLGKILQIADLLSLETYGNPSEELRAAVAAMNPQPFSFYKGL